MKRLTLILIFLGIASCFAAAVAPVYYGAAPGALAQTRARIAAKDATTLKALQKLISYADQALELAPVSVTQKTKLPPSGSNHDYMSLAPYYWPDSTKPGGRPYLRQDGKVNPESRESSANDNLRARLVGGTVDTLALAYALTGEEKYATHAAKFLRVWFLDPATHMNPHLGFAQAVAGANDGRGTGIIESRPLADAVCASVLLMGSAAWTKADEQGLAAWSAAFLDWLLTSKPGMDEQKAKNNHGTWYDVQAVRWALFLGKQEQARAIVTQAATRRIAVQVEPDGRQPLELARTATFSYSCFNLLALSELAQLGEHAGFDLWHYRTTDGRSIRAALDFLVPYLGKNPKPWILPQIHESNPDEVFPVLRRAARQYEAPAYERLLGEYEDTRSKRFQLLLLP